MAQFNQTSGPEDFTPLMRGVLANNISYIINLLELGVNIDKQNKFGQTALHIALAQPEPNPDLLRLLCQYGANPTLRQKKGNIQPLEMAAKLRNREALTILQECIKKYSSKQPTLKFLEEAERRVATESVNDFSAFLLSKKDLLKSLRLEDLRKFIISKNLPKPYSNALLFVFYDNLDEAKDYILNDYHSLIHYFIANQNNVLLQKFVEMGGDVNESSIQQNSPLTTAIINKNFPAAFLLLSHPSLDQFTRILGISRQFPEENIPDFRSLLEKISTNEEFQRRFEYSASDLAKLDEFKSKYDLLYAVWVKKNRLRQYGPAANAPNLGKEVYLYLGHGKDICDQNNKLITLAVPENITYVYYAQCGLVSRPSPQLNKIGFLMQGENYFLQDPLRFKANIQGMIRNFLIPNQPDLRVASAPQLITKNTFLPVSILKDWLGNIELGLSGLVSQSSLLSKIGPTEIVEKFDYKVLNATLN